MNVQAERRILLAYRPQGISDAPLIGELLSRLSSFVYRLEPVETVELLLKALSNPLRLCIMMSDDFSDDVPALIHQVSTLPYPIYPQPIVVYGDSDDESVVRTMLQAGAFDYVQRRELSPIRLMTAIEGAIRLRDSEAGLRHAQARNLRWEEIATQSIQRYQMATTTVSAMIFDYDVLTGYVERSVGLFALTGYTPEEAQPTRAWWNTLIHPDDRERITAEYAAYLADRDPSHNYHAAEFRLIHRDGHTVYVWSQSLLSHDAEGTVIRVLGSVTDVTARKRAEQALEVSQERFRLASEAVQALIYDYNFSTGTVERSTAMTSMLGYSLDEVEPSSAWWLAHVHPDDLEVPRQNAARAFTDPTIHTIENEYRFRHKDGHWVHLWDRAVYLRDQNGIPTRIVGSSIDVSALKQTEIFAEAIAQIALTLNSTLDLAQVLENILDTLSQVVPYDTVNLMLITDHQTRVMGMRGFEKHGLTPIETALDNFIVSIDQHPDLHNMATTLTPLIIPDIERHSSPSDVALASGLRSYLGTAIVFDGEVLGFLHLNALAPDFFTAEDAEHLQVFAAQAAVAIHNAIALEHARELSMLKERQRIARDLHDSVSQLLFSAALLSETLMRVPDHPQFAYNLEQLWRLNRGALAEMRKLVVEMRDADLEAFNLTEMLGQLANAAMGHADQLQVTVRADGGGDLPVKVRTTFYRITQEALNNVIKHARATSVEILLQCGKNEAALTVKDNGRGFDQSQISWSSVGLSNMRERARSIGSDCEIISRAGEGTLIHVEWIRPSVAAPPPVKEKRPRKSAPPSKS